MATQQRLTFKLPSSGPYVAYVVNNNDVGKMGSFEVVLKQGSVDVPELSRNQTLPVNYCSPFYGITNIDYAKPQNSKDYNLTQKSYGFWMVPPDIGTQVLVIFVDGDPNQGYWLGCIQERYQNHMVPDIAYQTLAPGDITSEQFQRYQTYELPVAEMNKPALKQENALNRSIANLVRPVHPFADRLLEQGLLVDKVRGITSSSATREYPSNVFGISTPGPVDKSDLGLKDVIEYDNKSTTVPVSRLGGSVFVMDDGDENGNNELIRIRTRTGHQILLHNSADLIYIANSKGTAWIELTSNGKIDIYAKDSVSIRSEADFNLRADRNFNIEAGQNVNIKANNNIFVNTGNDFELLTKNNAKLTSEKSVFFESDESFNITVKDEYKLSGKGVSVTASGSIKLTGGKVELNGSQKINLTSPRINNNTEPAAKATAATSDRSTELELNDLPLVLAGGDWSKRYQAGTLKSILQRAPTHEPWPEHESNKPAAFTPDKTDITPEKGGWGESGGESEGVPRDDPIGTFLDIVFTSNTGDEAHFRQTKPELQSAVQQAAKQYRELTGKPIVITSSYRSVAEQQALYDRWIAAGGGPNRPYAGGLYIPAKPVPGRLNTHARGISIDTPDAGELERLGILKKVGLYRPIPGTDPVHIVLVSARNASSE